MSEQNLDFVDGQPAPAPPRGERVPCVMQRSVGNAGACQTGSPPAGEGALSHRLLAQDFAGALVGPHRVEDVVGRVKALEQHELIEEMPELAAHGNDAIAPALALEDAANACAPAGRASWSRGQVELAIGVKHGGACTEKLRAGLGIEILRPALTLVAAVAVLLGGFTFAGNVVGLWDPVEPQGGNFGARLAPDRRGSDAVSRAIPASAQKPSPPISVRSALLIALASSVLIVLPSCGRRLARRLDDLVGPQALGGPALPRRILRRLGQRATRVPVTAVGRRIFRPEWTRQRRPHSTPLRQRSVGALRDFYPEAVMVTLAVASGIATGFLVVRLLGP
jgi:hypothetical protein